MNDSEILRIIEEYLQIDINSGEGDAVQIYELQCFGRYLIDKYAAQQGVQPTPLSLSTAETLGDNSRRG